MLPCLCRLYHRLRSGIPLSHDGERCVSISLYALAGCYRRIDLSSRHVGICLFDARDHYGFRMGSLCLGFLLELGPQGNGFSRHVAGLCPLPPRSYVSEMARHPCRPSGCYRLWICTLYVCGGELSSKPPRLYLGTCSHYGDAGIIPSRFPTRFVRLRGTLTNEDPSFGGVVQNFSFLYVGSEGVTVKQIRLSVPLCRPQTGETITPRGHKGIHYDLIALFLS